LLQEFL